MIRPRVPKTVRAGAGAGAGAGAVAALPYQWRVTNTVCTARVSRTFSRDAMKTIAGFVGGCYDGDIFPPCVIRLVEPKVTCGVFPTGKIVACGAPHKDIARLGMAMIIQKISAALAELLHLLDFHLENIVASARLPFELNLALYHADNLGTRHYTIYHPKKFPGIHQFFGPVRPCIVLFDTGAILVTGIKDLSEASMIVAMIPFHLWQRGHEYRNSAFESSMEQDLVEQFTSLTSKEQKKESKERLVTKNFRKRHPILVEHDDRKVLYNHWSGSTQ